MLDHWGKWAHWPSGLTNLRVAPRSPRSHGRIFWDELKKDTALQEDRNIEYDGVYCVVNVPTCYNNHLKPGEEKGRPKTGRVSFIGFSLTSRD